MNDTPRNHTYDRVLEAALVLAQTDGMETLTRDNVAAAAQVSAGTVNTCFGTVAALRDAVMRAAVARGILSIVAHGLATGSKIAAGAPPDLKEAAALSLAS